jgi:hypothetical protein
VAAISVVDRPPYRFPPHTVLAAGAAIMASTTLDRLGPRGTHIRLLSHVCPDVERQDAVLVIPTVADDTERVGTVILARIQVRLAGLAAGGG